MQLLAETGVMMTPGSVMHMEGWVRIGYANYPEILSAGLKQMSGFLANLRQSHADKQTNSEVQS